MLWRWFLVGNANMQVVAPTVVDCVTIAGSGKNKTLRRWLRKVEISIACFNYMCVYVCGILSGPASDGLTSY